MRITVAIVTYGRDQVLVDSLKALFALDPPPWEVVVVDQTPRHDESTELQLTAWSQEGRLRWFRLPEPAITPAMNRALLEARGERVLFVDDDIIPDPLLLVAHQRAAEAVPKALVAGRVLQTWHQGKADPDDSAFLFNSLKRQMVKEFIGCNVSMPRRLAMEIGGFDANFVKVAYRFEAEFCHRWLNAGLPIYYEPDALIHHLKTSKGGTRSYGEHLVTFRPNHAVGRYYYRLRSQPLAAALAGSGKDLVNSVQTRHHLRHPWWIPATLLAEARGLIWALLLNGRGAALLECRPQRMLIVGSHPIQYQTPLFQKLADDPKLAIDVLYLNLPTAETQGLGFGNAFTWDIPLLEGYPWHPAKSGRGRGITSGYWDVWLRHPLRELGFGPEQSKPDVILLTGWHFFGMVQVHVAAWIQRIPVLLRMDSNDFRPRPWLLDKIYWLLLRGVALGLPVGQANDRWYRSNGFPQERLIGSPHFIDNGRFAGEASREQQQRERLRSQWGIPQQAFCFIFAGKLQKKKRPQDLLDALALLAHQSGPPPRPVHLLMVGSGNLEAACRQRVATEGLPVSFAGFLNQSQIATAYAASDCLVLASDHGETWGLVVNEAMACGLPAVVSDQVGCAEDLVEQGVTGLRYPCGDTDALAACLTAMARDPVAAARMGHAARERVEEHFSIEAAAAGIRAAVARLAAGRAGTRPQP